MVNHARQADICINCAERAENVANGVNDKLAGLKERKLRMIRTLPGESRPGLGTMT